MQKAIVNFAKIVYNKQIDSSFVPSCRKTKPGLLFIDIYDSSGFVFCKATFVLGDKNEIHHQLVKKGASRSSYID